VVSGSGTSGVTPGLVLCAGCFDPLHYGHLLHFYAARSYGTRLVVALTSDRLVRAQKGARRPAVPQDERKALLLALRCVDEVIISDDAPPLALIQALRPAVYAKGIDYQGKELEETKLVLSLGGCVILTETPKTSSTALLSHLQMLENATVTAAAGSNSNVTIGA
jgi:rfaE bifunctional protein nucleotidyltransferase chain/domain